MQRTIRIEYSSLIAARLKDYAQLMKFRLSMLVVFSSGIGYLMGLSGASERRKRVPSSRSYSATDGKTL